MKPRMLHAANTRNIRQCSQLPAGSKTTICGGNSTDRNPCAIHLTGKKEPMLSIHPGNAINGT